MSRAVTDAMVEAALASWWYSPYTGDDDAMMRDALSAALAAAPADPRDAEIARLREALGVIAEGFPDQAPNMKIASSRQTARAALEAKP